MQAPAISAVSFEYMKAIFVLLQLCNQIKGKKTW